MGRTSFECDWVTRARLESLDYAAHARHPRTETRSSIASGGSRIGRLGTAARLAIPRLKELRNYPSPFVRMWAAEALERIVPHD